MSLGKKRVTIPQPGPIQFPEPPSAAKSSDPNRGRILATDRTPDGRMVQHVGKEIPKKVYTAIMATPDPGTDRMALGPDALKEFAKSAKGMTIGVNFNPTLPPVGVVTGAEIDENGNVKVEAVFHSQRIENILGAFPYVVPGFKLAKEHKAEVDGESVTVVDEAELFAVSLTNTPADPNVTKLVEKE